LMSASTTAPVGTPAALGNYARFTSNKADDLLKQWIAVTDPAKQKDISFQLQQVFADNAPIIPLYPQPLWEIYKTNNFTGFPTKDNPYASGVLDGSNSNMLLVFLKIKPK
jgi:peptide/nickel transport system substrate-binding protein